MTAVSRVAFVGGIALALLVFTVSWRPAAGPHRSGEPLVGGQAVSLLTPELRPAEDARRAAAGATLHLPEALRAPTFQSVVLHFLEGSTPPVDTEEGPAWHLCLEADAAVSITARGQSGRAGVPAGATSAQTTAIHVMIPQARALSGARLQTLGDLARGLLHRVRCGPEGLSCIGIQVELPQGWWP